MEIQQSSLGVTSCLPVEPSKRQASALCMARKPAVLQLVHTAVLWQLLFEADVSKDRKKGFSLELGNDGRLQVLVERGIEEGAISGFSPHKSEI